MVNSTPTTLTTTTNRPPLVADNNNNNNNNKRRKWKKTSSIRSTDNILITTKNDNNNNNNNNADLTTPSASTQQQQQQQQQQSLRHPIDKHWFMFIRRIYLTYNAILAAMLIMLQGVSFGIQLFYMFRLVEIEEKQSPLGPLLSSPLTSSSFNHSSHYHMMNNRRMTSSSPITNYSNARVVCYQLSIVGMLGVTCFTFSSLLSKVVQFMRLVWSYEQFMRISEKFSMFLVSFRTGCTVPRWINLFLQLFLIIVLEIVPICCGIVFTIVHANISIGVQAFLSVGSFVTLAIILLWWVGSIFENYKRLLMFFTHRKKYFERMRSLQHNLDELDHTHTAPHHDDDDEDKQQKQLHDKSMGDMVVVAMSNSRGSREVDENDNDDENKDGDDDNRKTRNSNVVYHDHDEDDDHYHHEKTSEEEGRSMEIHENEESDHENDNHNGNDDDDDDYNDDSTLSSAIEVMESGVEDGEMLIEAEDGTLEKLKDHRTFDSLLDKDDDDGDVESGIIVAPTVVSTNESAKMIETAVTSTKSVVTRASSSIIEQQHGDPLSITPTTAASTNFTTSPSTRHVSHSRQSSSISVMNLSTFDEISEFQEISHVENLKTVHHSLSSNYVNVSKEKNLWILLAWYCCLTPIGVPNLVRRWRDRSSKAKVYFVMREVWLVCTMFLLILAVSAFGLVQQWKIYALSAVFLTIIILNMSISKLVSIPEHKPSKRRLKSAWRDSFVQRYIAVVEEVFYNSPTVVFTSSKLLTYLFIIVLAVCRVFDFSDYHLIFLLPTFLCAYICVLYILRFNFRSYIEWLSWLTPGCLSKKTAGVKDDNNGHKSKSPHNTMLGESSSLLHVSFSKSDVYLKNTHQIPAYMHTKSEHPLFRVLSVLTFTSVTLVLIVALLILTCVSVSWAAMLVLLFMLFSVCFILFKRFEQDAADALLGFFLFYIVLMGFVFVIGGLNDNANEVRNFAKIGVVPNDTMRAYDICSDRWHDFSIVDYAFFANLAYSQDPYWANDFKEWFPNCRDCRVVVRYNETIHFYDLYIPAKNLSIVGVRGTTTAQDIIQDFDIWKEAVLLQGASLLGPFVTFWPERLTTGIIYWIYRIELFTMNPSMQQERFYYQVLDEYVEDIKTQRNVILAGHSLGGGLAKIVGARHGITSISFSSPGVVWTRRKLGLALESINRVDVNVKPNVDLVARVDRDGGLVQNIDCDLSFVQCHSILRTTQNLIRSCGSMDGGRNRWIE